MKKTVCIGIWQRSRSLQCVRVDYPIRNINTTHEWADRPLTSMPQKYFHSRISAWRKKAGEKRCQVRFLSVALSIQSKRRIEIVMRALIHSRWIDCIHRYIRSALKLSKPHSVCKQSSGKWVDGLGLLSRIGKMCDNKVCCSRRLCVWGPIV